MSLFIPRMNKDTNPLVVYLTGEDIYVHYGREMGYVGILVKDWQGIPKDSVVRIHTIHSATFQIDYIADLVATREMMYGFINAGRSWDYWSRHKIKSIRIEMKFFLA